MPITQLTITVPSLADNSKKMEAEGAIAAGESVAVTISGIPAGVTTDGKKLRLRVLGPMGEDLATHGDWTVEGGGDSDSDSDADVEELSYKTVLSLATVQAYRLFSAPPPPPPPPRVRPLPPVGYDPRMAYANAQGAGSVRLLLELRDGDEDASMLGICQRPLVYWPIDCATATLVDLADGMVYSKAEVDALLAQKADRSDLATKADLVGGKVPSEQLPSYVDDVLEFASLSAFPNPGEEGKIYVALDTNKTYRWSGTQYVMIGGGDPPVPYTNNPAMDGNAAPGSSDAYARGDHVHPTDTSRMAATANGDTITTGGTQWTEAPIGIFADGITSMLVERAHLISLAPVYSETSAYHRGDLVTYSEFLYVATTDTPSPAGEFSTTIWNLVNVSTLLAAKAKATDLATHVADTVKHVTAADKTAWNGKQNAIADLETIRSGAAAGATAYQKPSYGIPVSDLDTVGEILEGPLAVDNKGSIKNYVAPANSVLKGNNKGEIVAATAGTDYVAPSSLAAVATSGSYNDLVDTPTIPTVPAISTDISADATSDTKTASPKAVKTFVEGKGYITSYTETDPVFGAQRNMLAYASTTTLAPGTACYRSSLASDGTFPTVDATAITTAAAYYQFELELAVPSTVPSTITGPTGWTWVDGHGLPDPAGLSGGETVYISVRLDCTARTFLSSVWRVA